MPIFGSKIRVDQDFLIAREINTRAISQAVGAVEDYKTDLEKEIKKLGEEDLITTWNDLKTAVNSLFNVFSRITKRIIRQRSVKISRRKVEVATESLTEVLSREKHISRVESLSHGKEFINAARTLHVEAGKLL
jgi:hypothetical protein